MPDTPEDPVRAEGGALDSVQLDYPQDGVCVIRLNRPHVQNALTRAMVADINAALDAVARDQACRVVIITGTGKGFCSGQDMQAANARNTVSPSGVVEKMHWQEQFAGMVQRIRGLPQPVIAAVNGAAVGAGMALALAADIRIAAPGARFLIGAVRIGLSAGESGISYHLPRLIGAGHAFEIELTGRPVEADEALALGLVTKVVTAAALMETALAQAQAILANSPFSVQQTKQVMWASLDAGTLSEAIALENRTQILCTMTDDYKEATAAFMAKRPPQFTGR